MQELFQTKEMLGFHYEVVSLQWLGRDVILECLKMVREAWYGGLVSERWRELKIGCPSGKASVRTHLGEGISDGGVKDR